jgi:hypothetical protein
MADHAASPEPEPAEPMKVPYGSDKLLSWVSVLWPTIVLYERRQ